MQCASQVIFLCCVMLLLCSCTNAPRLVYLSQNSTNSEDPTLIKFIPLLRAACSAQHAYHNDTYLSTAAISPRSLSRVRPMFRPAALTERKQVQIGCTCPARAMCTQCQLSTQRCDAPTLVHQCAEFGDVSSKIHKLGGSRANKVFHIQHVPPVPLDIG